MPCCAVLQADQPGTSGQARPAGAVVADGEVEDRGGGVEVDDDADGGGVGVLDGVGQRLGDDVVGADLDLLGQPVLHAHVELDRDR